MPCPFASMLSASERTCPVTPMAPGQGDPVVSEPGSGDAARSTLGFIGDVPQFKQASLRTQTSQPQILEGADLPTSLMHRAISAVDVRGTDASTSGRVDSAPHASIAHSASMPSLAPSSSKPLAPWQLRRPVLKDCPKLKRRDLRRLNRTWSLKDVSQHHYVDDVWIAVDGKVYDITEHLVNHEGWGTAGVTTPLSILAHAGIDCSEEFHAIHRVYPIAYRQLAAYYIGDLADADHVAPIA